MKMKSYKYLMILEWWMTWCQISSSPNVHIPTVYSLTFMSLWTNSLGRGTCRCEVKPLSERQSLQWFYKVLYKKPEVYTLQGLLSLSTGLSLLWPCVAGMWRLGLQERKAELGNKVWTLPGSQGGTAPAHSVTFFSESFVTSDLKKVRQCFDLHHPDD